jgi:hypothetical protein
MSFEYKQPTPQPEKEAVDERSLEDIESDLELAKQNVELWRDSRDTLMQDLDEVETKEGELRDDDTRLFGLKVCFMNLEDAEEELHDLKMEHEEAVKREGSN